MARALRIAGILSAALSFFLYVQADLYFPLLQAAGFAVSGGLFLASFLAGDRPRLGAGYALSIAAFGVATAVSAWAGSWEGAAREPLLQGAAALLAGTGLAAAALRAPRGSVLWGGALVLAALAVYGGSVLRHPAGIHGPPFGNSTVAAGFFAAAGAFLAACLLHLPPKGRGDREGGGGSAFDGAAFPALCMLALSVSLAALWVAGSEAGWIGLGAGALAALATRFPARRRAILAGTLLLLAGAGWIGWRSLPESPEKPRWDHLLYETSAGVRLHLWQGSLAAIREAPILGHGPGSFFQVFPAHRPAAWLGAAAEGTWGAWEPLPHSLLLEIAVERGLLGLGLFLWIVRLALLQGLGSADPLRQAAAAGGCALLANGLLSVAPSYPQGQVLLWTLLAVCGLPDPAPSTRLRLRRGARGGWGMALGSAALLLWAREAVIDRVRILVPALSAAADSRAASAVEESDPAGAGRLSARAEAGYAAVLQVMEAEGEGSPLRSHTLFRRARARLRQGDAAGALRAFREIEAFTAAYTHLDRIRGEIHAQRGDRARARARFAAHAQSSRFERDLYWGAAGGVVDPGDRAGWGAFLPPLARALRMRPWDLAAASTCAVYAARAGEAGTHAEARRAADRLYAHGEAPPWESVALYARLYQHLDRARAAEVIRRFLAEHPGHAEALQALAVLERQ